MEYRATPKDAVKPSTPLESKSKSFLISLCMLLNEILSERKSSKEHKEVNRRATPRVKEMKRLANKRYLATPKGKELDRMYTQRYRATPRGKERKRLQNKRFRATPDGKEKKRLADKRYYERTKHLRKLGQSSQDIDLGA